VKILIPTMGTRGDVQPYIALAEKLKLSGFDAVIATHPCWRKLICGYNIEFAPIGPDIDIEYEAAKIRGNAKHWILGALQTAKFIMSNMEKASDELLKLCKECDLVIVSHSQVGGAEAEASGVPYISVSLQPDVIPKKLDENRIYKRFKNNLISAIISPPMVAPYNKLRTKLGLKKVKTFDQLISPYLNIIPISSTVYPPNELWEDKNKVIGYWFLDDFENYSPSWELKEFLEGGPPPVIVALGAMSFESSTEKNKLDIIVNSISKSGMRGIIQGFNRTMENYILPNNIIRVDSIPHSWLFRQGYCVIHHGGLGTTASALKAGVPAIVIPHVLDQYLWANKIYELNAGPKPVSCKDLTESNLIEVIDTLKRNYNEISSSVKAISEKINNEDGLTKTVEIIKEVLIELCII
jgi:sterol 3beta-glucosyltransferase